MGHFTTNSLKVALGTEFVISRPDYIQMFGIRPMSKSNLRLYAIDYTGYIAKSMIREDGEMTFPQILAYYFVSRIMKYLHGM